MLLLHPLKAHDHVKYPSLNGWMIVIDRSMQEAERKGLRTFYYDADCTRVSGFVEVLAHILTRQSVRIARSNKVDDIYSDNMGVGR